MLSTLTRPLRGLAGVAVLSLAACVHAPPPWPGQFDPLLTRIAVAPAVPALGFRRAVDQLDDLSFGVASEFAFPVGVQGSIDGSPVGDAMAGIAVTIALGEALGGLLHADAAFEHGGREVLQAALAERPLAERLAAALPSPPAAMADPAWTATVELTRLTVLGGGRSSRLRLQLHATLTLQRAGETVRHGPWAFDTISVGAQSVGLWSVDDRAALHATLDGLVTSLSAQLLTAMRQHAAPPG